MNSGLREIAIPWSVLPLFEDTVGSGEYASFCRDPNCVISSCPKFELIYKSVNNYE